MEEKGYPKFQYSVFLKNGKDQQFVVRAESLNDFKLAIADLLVAIKHVETLNAATPSITGDQTNRPMCAIHHIAMTWKEGVSKKNNKPYAFWSCSERDAEGNFCNYKPE